MTAFGSDRGGRGAERGCFGNRFCSHCKIPGHARNYCNSLYPKLRWIRAAKMAATNPSTASSKTLTEEEYSQFRSLLSGVSPSTSQTPTATMVRDKGNICHISTASKSMKWINDSGASDHMTAESGIFTSLSSTHNASTVILADGFTSTVAGIGCTFPTSLLSLSSVLYIPTFPFNLLSVSKLIYFLHCLVTFTPTACTLQDLETKKLIGTGYEFRGIWGGKGQGKTIQIELIFRAMRVEPVIMSAGELESERAGKDELFDDQ